MFVYLFSFLSDLHEEQDLHEAQDEHDEDEHAAESGHPMHFLPLFFAFIM